MSIERRLPLQEEFDKWLKDNGNTDASDAQYAWYFLCRTFGKELGKSEEFMQYCRNYSCCSEKMTHSNHCTKEILDCYRTATDRDRSVIRDFNSTQDAVISFLSRVYEGAHWFIENGHRFPENNERTNRIRIAIESITETPR